jgi:peptidyl-dipeptidase A
VVDRWRWEVFAGEVGPDRYNADWWELRARYQGVQPPLPRSEADFDPGAKYHVPAGVPYTRYFLAAILQFQFHRALCRIAGHEGPLHTCSIYGSREAGRRLQEMMALGASRPWPEALKILTGEERMDAGAMIEYFQPLLDWLEAQNRGRKCGWNDWAGS